VQIILAEVIKEQDQTIVDQLINEFSLDKIFGIQPGEGIYL